MLQHSPPGRRSSSASPCPSASKLSINEFIPVADADGSSLLLEVDEADMLPDPPRSEEEEEEEDTPLASTSFEETDSSNFIPTHGKRRDTIAVIIRLI